MEEDMEEETYEGSDSAMDLTEEAETGPHCISRLDSRLDQAGVDSRLDQRLDQVGFRVAETGPHCISRIDRGGYDDDLSRIDSVHFIEFTCKKQTLSGKHF